MISGGSADAVGMVMLRVQLRTLRATFGGRLRTVIGDPTVKNQTVFLFTPLFTTSMVPKVQRDEGYRTFSV